MSRPTLLPECSGQADRWVGWWCLYHEVHAFRALVRVEEAAEAEGLLRVRLTLGDLAPQRPRAAGPVAGDTLTVSTCRDGWNQIWTLRPVTQGTLEEARAHLSAAMPIARLWSWVEQSD